ncbi:endonuclease III, partial [Patescibacteria group bacterium]|nr:endonuclease III [Patescibacteria group bacterium]
KDETTAAVTKRLFSIASTPSKIILLPETKLKKLIYPIGFYNVKAKNIKNVARIIHTQYNDTAPKTRAELLDLPGTGRKTANLVLSKAFNIPAICVDTHVHRIPNRWGYIRTKTPFETEMRLQKKLPKKYWIEFNYLLVAYGQSVCTPVSPRCSSCVIREYCKRVGVKKSR